MDSVELAKRIRIDSLNMVHHARASHIGSAFSVADILAVLFADILKYDAQNPRFEGRDRLVLSKGHAGVALYSALAEIGFFDKKQLDYYEDNGGFLSGHISHKGVPGVEFSTGSLGHGVCVAAGMALALKLNKSNSKVYVIVGDGECDEGSFWEMILFANQYNLSNLVVIVDRNHMQAMGDISKVMETGDLCKKIEQFGWNVNGVDGHNHQDLKDALLTRFNNEKPYLIVAYTIKGKGVSFMENALLWHYRDPQGDFYDKALKELNGDK